MSSAIAWKVHVDVREVNLRPTMRHATLGARPMRWLVALSLLEVSRPYALPSRTFAPEVRIAAAPCARSHASTMQLGGGFGGLLRNVLGGQGEQVDPRADDL